MPALTANDEEMEDAYPVPTHLDVQESIGPLPRRLFFAGLGVWVTYTLVQTMFPSIVWPDNKFVLLVVGSFLPYIPFAIWWVNPPPEHGLAVLVRHLIRPKHLDPDKLAHYQKMRVEDRVFYYGAGEECLTIWRLPTFNIDSASVAATRRHRGQWGRFLDGLGHEVVIAIRARPLTRSSAIVELFEHGSEEAKKLAKWLQGQLGEQTLIERERLLIIPAPDPETLRDRCKRIRESMARFDWEPIEPETDNDLKKLVNSFWPHRSPKLDRIGPGSVNIKQGELVVDGEYVRSYAYELPSNILTNWWSFLVDDTLPADVCLDIRPRDVGEGKRHLDQRLIGLSTSKWSPARELALIQLRGLRNAMERSRIKPFQFSMLITIRASTREELDDLDRRLRQLVRDNGSAKVHLLKWEQWEAFERLAPLGKQPMPRRHRRIESGTLARTTPLTSSMMQLEGGVPLGLAGSAPCLFWTRAGQKNAHMAFYAGSGAGKGYTVKVLESRNHFKNDVSIWGIDSDEDHEYAGRFCTYLKGQAPPIRCAADVDKVEITRRSTVVIWDLSECPDEEYGEAVVKIIEKLVEYARTYGVPTDFFLDEANNIKGHGRASAALKDLVQRGRHWGIGVIIITQLVSDWLNSELGDRVHGLVDSWWCGQQNPNELEKARKVLRLSPEQVARIEGAAIGTGLLATSNGQRRCWLDLRNKASPEEHDMAHTTPRGNQTQRRRVRYAEERLMKELRQDQPNGRLHHPEEGEAA